MLKISIAASANFCNGKNINMENTPLNMAS